MNTTPLLRAVAAYACAALVAPLLVGFVTLLVHRVDGLRLPDVAPIDFPAPVAPRSDRRIALVVTGAGGAEMTDFLLPYEVLARTGAFDTWVVAPARRVIPLASTVSRDGGLDLVPDYSFEEYDRLVGRVPDVIVIPYLPDFASGGEPAIAPWLQRQAGRGTLLLSICAGAEVLAATGLLDGESATTHPSVIDELQEKHPKVRWRRDVRFVENARGITSGAVASGMDATLAAVRRLLGTEEAVRVAKELGYRHLAFLDAPAFHELGPDPAAVASSAFRPVRARLGIVLHDGVSEIALGSLFDVFSSTLGYRLEALAQERRVLTSRHGLRLVPRHTLMDAPPTDRVLVPGIPTAPTLSAAQAFAAARGIPLSLVHAAPEEFPYDSSLRALSRLEGALVARSVANNLNYPSAHVKLEGPDHPPLLLVGPLIAAALGVWLVALVRRSGLRLHRGSPDA